MSLFKVALLEDNPHLLKDLKRDLEETKLVKVVVWATNSEEFLDKIIKEHVDALMLDIDLTGDSMTGLDIANKINLPVLFISGKTKEFIDRIENHNLNTKVHVDAISKPITPEKLSKILPKFIEIVKTQIKYNYILLNTLHNKGYKVEINDIVFICTDKSYGSSSNNKRIFFKNRLPDTLIDFSFVKMDNIGFPLDLFITTHGSYRVNKKHVNSYNPNDHKINVDAMDETGVVKNFKIPVSENHIKNVHRSMNR